MKTPKPTPDELASRCNPIIGYSSADTLHNAACVASFLARLQLDRSDWHSISAVGAPDPLSVNETRGLSLLTETLAAALWFEVEGRPNEEGKS